MGVMSLTNPSQQFNADERKLGMTFRCDYLCSDYSLEGDERDALVDIQNLKMQEIDDGVILNFKLQKGSYATEVVKYLFS